MAAHEAGHQPLEEFRFDVEHVQGRLNPAFPLTRPPAGDRCGGGRRRPTRCGSGSAGGARAAGPPYGLQDSFIPRLLHPAGRCTCATVTVSPNPVQPGPGGHDLSGGRPGDAATKELLDAAEVGKLRPRWEGPFPVAVVAPTRGSSAVRRSTSTGSSPTSFGRAGPPPLARSPTRGRRGSTWWSSSAGPVHPSRRLPDADRRLRGRGRHAPRSGHLRLSLGLAGPAAPPPESPPERDYRQRSPRVQFRRPDRLKSGELA